MTELTWKKIYNNTSRAVDSYGMEYIKLHNTVIVKKYLGRMVYSRKA